LIGKDHSPWLVTVAKLEFKIVIRVFVFISAVVNIGHAFEYQAMTDVLFSPIPENGFHYRLYQVSSDIYADYTGLYYSAIFRSYYDYPVPNNHLSFFIYSIVYFILNFVVLFVVNTSVEVMIVRVHAQGIESKTGANVANE
jgi:hypothetical protein